MECKREEDGGMVGLWGCGWWMVWMCVSEGYTVGGVLVAMVSDVRSFSFGGR